MSFTKITNAGFGLTTGTLVGVAASFSSTVSVGGTLTYEDVTNVDSVGLITARNGIEVTDKGVQVGTGATVDSAAANTLTFLTGGSERLSIGSNGRVNIGQASSSDHTLCVAAEDDTTSLTGGHNQGIQLQNKSTTDGTYSQIEWRTAAGGRYARIAGIQDDANGNGGQLVFLTETSGGSTTEALRIDSSGRLLLGTSNTDHAVSYADNLVIGTTSGDNGMTIVSGTSDAGSINFSDGSGSGETMGIIQYSHNSNSLYFYVNSSERLRIDSSGRLLVGNSSTSNSGLLCVKGSAADATGGGQISIQRGQSVSGADQHLGDLNFGEGSANTVQIRAFAGANWTSGTDRPSYMSFMTTPSSSGSPTERMRIDSSGRVLIGTTTEGYSTADDLTIENSTDVGITLRSATDGYGGVFFSDSTSGAGEYDGYLQYNQSSRSLAVGTASATQMTITSAGKVGVGVAAPDEKLTVQSGSATDGRVQAHGFICRNNWGGASGLGNGMASPSSNALMFTTNSTERMRIDSSGRVLIGTTTEGYAGAELFTIASSGNAGITIRTGTTSNGTLAFSDATSGSDEYDGYIQYRHASQDLVLATDGEERARFSSGGAFLLVPNTNVDTIYSSVASSGTSAAVFRGLHSATVGTPGSGTDSIFIFANGNIQNTNNSYGQISDIKLKENIVDAGSQWSDFKSVRFRKYNFKSETGHETNTQLGVVAQELELTSPGLVYETVDRDIDGNDLGTKTKGVKSSILTMKALVALQEAMARIETLETQNADLLSRVTALEG